MSLDVTFDISTRSSPHRRQVQVALDVLPRIDEEVWLEHHTYRVAGLIHYIQPGPRQKVTVFIHSELQ